MKNYFGFQKTKLWSPSTRRAWIEISNACSSEGQCIAVALHTEGVDRNKNGSTLDFGYLVALHTEGVDRNRMEG